jgi:hypothetical protein
MDRAPTTALYRRLLAAHRNRIAAVQMDIMNRTTEAVLFSAPDPTAPYTPADRQRALRRIDQALAEHYGRYRGDEQATILRIILEDARTALIAAYDYSIEQLETALRRRRR